VRDAVDFLDTVVYGAFKDVGQRLESLYCQTAAPNPAELNQADATDVADCLDRLSNYAYQISLTMMVRIREGKVGRLAPDQLADTRLQTEQ
jgi:hypothetical protein